MLNEDSGEYHLYVTNLARDNYHAPDIAQLYRARWEIELLFKELKSRFGLDCSVESAEGDGIASL